MLGKNALCYLTILTYKTVKLKSNPHSKRDDVAKPTTWLTYDLHLVALLLLQDRLCQ